MQPSISKTSKPRLKLVAPKEEPSPEDEIWTPEFRVYGDHDFPARSLKPYAPFFFKKRAQLEEFYKRLRPLDPEIRQKVILKGLGLKKEQLQSYPTLDPQDPEFKKKFDMELFMNEPRYGIESFMRIDTKEKKVVNFKLNVAQLAFYFNRTGRDVILKARQHGVSTLILGIYLLDSMLNPATVTAILTHEKDATENLLRRMKMMYESIPRWIRPPLKRNSKDYIEFGGMDGSAIIIQVVKASGQGEKKDRSSGTGRSHKFNNVHFSEPAFYEGVSDKDLLGLLEAIPAGDHGSTFIESTPNGVGGFFFKECEDALHQKGNKKFFRLPWFINFEYDEKWRKTKRRERQLRENTAEGDRQWGQEYECDFLQSQSNYFLIDICEPTSIYQKRIKTDPLGNLYPHYVYIYVEPVPRGRYVLAGDIAQGLDHGDFTSITVLDRETRVEVAQIYGKFSPEDSAKLVYWLARKFNFAFVGIENEKNGMVVLHILDHELDYPNLFYYRNEYSIRHGGGGQLGWSTNVKTRPVMFAELRKALTEDALALAFPLRATEMKIFTIIDLKPQAPPEENDDTIVSAAIANRLLDFPETMYREEEVEMDITRYGGSNV